MKENMKSSELKLKEETQELDILAKQFKEMENRMRKEIEGKNDRLKELTSLINQKE